MIELQNQIKTKIDWEEIKHSLPKEERLFYGGNFEKIFLGYARPISKIQFEEGEKIMIKGKAVYINSREEMIEKIIKGALEMIAENYIGRSIKKENSHVCYQLIRKHFSHISIPEIILAFELAVIGTINVDLNLYGNQISGFYIGQVLRKYCDYRAKGIRVIRNAIRQYSTPSHMDENVKYLKNKNARIEMVDEITSSYRKFVSGNPFKFKFGMKKLLQKLGYQLPIVKSNAPNANQYRNQVVKTIDSLTVTSTFYDETINTFFTIKKENGITPAQFEKDIQSKLEQYENNNTIPK